MKSLVLAFSFLFPVLSFATTELSCQWYKVKLDESTAQMAVYNSDYEMIAKGSAHVTIEDTTQNHTINNPSRKLTYSLLNGMKTIKSEDSQGNSHYWFNEPRYQSTSHLYDCVVTSKN